MTVLADLDGGIARNFRSRGELAVFNLALEAIEQAVNGAWRAAHGVVPDPLPQLETAIETMLHVSAAVRLPRYLDLTARDERLPATAGEALEMGAGLCGQQTQVFASLARALGLEVRQVGFAFTTELGPETHAAVEVVVNGTWRFLDVTWCSYWADGDGTLLELDEILALDDRDASRVTNLPALAIAPHTLAGRDPFAYLDGERWLLSFEDRILA